jgi:sarcosine oxidase subunit gamma
MAEAMLERAPLAHRAADLARLGAAEIAFLTQVDVRCPPDVAARLGFPLEPNTVAGDDVRGMLWLGPDEWLVVGLPGRAQATIAELETALAGTRRSVVDVSANRAVLELRTANRLALLASGCGLDLDPAGGWTAGRCAQTLFARAPVLLQERADATRVFVRPSYADYTVDRLLAAVDPTTAGRR